MNKSIKIFLLCSLAMLVTFAGSSIFSNAMASSDEKEEYKSYERNDYTKSKNIIVNENNCINNNNINVNTIGNSDVSSSGGLIAREDGNEKETYASTYGTNEDRYSKQNDKSFSCIINNNNSIITKDGDNLTDVGNIRPTCEECFEDWLTAPVIESFLNLKSEDDLSDLCTILLTTRIDRESFMTDILFAGATEEMANNLVDCLVWAGVRFT
jgi:hypothetical protein